MITDKNRVDRKEEIQGVIDLLQECLKEEGYEIPFSQGANDQMKSFRIPLKNGVYKTANNPEYLTIKVEWF